MPPSTTSPSEEPNPQADPVDDRDDFDDFDDPVHDDPVDDDPVDKFDDFDDGRSTDADGTPAGAVVVARTSSRSSRRGTSAS